MAKLLKFESGLNVCYQRARNSGSCAFGIFVNAGSRNEEENENGVAHFIEHTLFKGTEKRTAFDIANEIDKLGANSNAYTSKTNTVYYVSGLAKFLPEYMDVLSDMLFHSTFTEENLEKERGVVLEEIKMYEDDGDSVCSDLLSERYFGTDPLSRPILGTEESVKSLDEGKIRSFMARYYVPENMCLSYAGPATEEEIRALTERYFEREFLSRKHDFVRQKPKKPKVHSGFVKRTDKPFEQATVMIRFPAYPITDKREESAFNLAYILGGGMSSRLFQKVREENGYVYEIYASPVSVTGFGYIDIGFATAPELTEKAILCIRDVIEEGKKNGFTEEEFRKVKLQRETGAVLSAETTFDAMRLMGKYYLMTGKPETQRSLMKKMEKTTLEDVEKAFNDIFDYRKAMVGYVGKKCKKNLASLLKKGEENG